MKEVIVAKLDKEDSARHKELERYEMEIRALIAEAQSKHIAFWEELRVKYSLVSGGHYLKRNAIYKQEI